MNDLAKFFDFRIPTDEEMYEILGFSYKEINEAIDEMFKIIPPGDKRWDCVSRAMDILSKGRPDGSSSRNNKNI